MYMKKHSSQIEFHEYENFEIVSGTCNHSFPVHIHQSLCVGTITDGQASFMVRGKKEILVKGDSYIIPPYVPHTLSSINGRRFGYSVFCFKNYSPPLLVEDYISSALSLIENESSQLKIEAVANEVHISKFHLERKFKEQIGITPYQLYLSKKVKKIRQGLLSHKSLTDLAFDLGFSDESHLCNTFKKHMGITPLQFVSSYKIVKEARE